MNVLGYEPDSTDWVAAGTAIGVIVAWAVWYYFDASVWLAATIATGAMYLSMRLSNFGGTDERPE